MDEFTNTEKTVIAHLSIHHRIVSNEPAVQKIFGGNEDERKKVLTSLRDRGFLKHYKRKNPDLQYIVPSMQARTLGSGFCSEARSGKWTPENITLGE